MAEKIPTPSYGEGKSISNYEKEIAAWEIITKTARDKRGVMLALNLDENLKNRVLENVSIQDLHKDTGVQDLLIYLKKTFGKDELTDSKECYKEFRDYKRKSGQNIHDYIEEFASRVNKLQNRGVIIANEILAFELIERANITPIEEKLVSTGLDFSKKEEMYNDAKIALKKFLRETTVNKEAAACAVRVESVNEATQEVAYNNSYPRRGGYNFYQNNRSRNYQHQAGNARFNNNFQKPSIKNSRSQQNNRVENFNPRGRYGEFLLCHRCGSNRHFIKNCPRKENSFITLCEEDEKENTLTFEQIKESPVLVLEHKDKTLSIEARGCAVIDTACASTVAGEDWFEDYVKNHLTPEDRKKIVKKEGKRIFRFGAGPPIKSIAEVVMPAFVAGMRVSLVADIVRNDIPLLLSITSIKNANGIIFTNNSVISLFGKKIHCLESSTGHWMMPLVEEIKIKDVCVVDISTISGDELEKTLLKLHAQFGHPAKQKLIYLLKNANMWNDNCDALLEKIQNSCKICKQFTKTPARPVVALPVAKRFNEAVCMDLKQWKGNWILHMVDMYSRYIQSIWVPRKGSRDILDAVIENWCGIFGVMEIMLTDNGGEFTSEEIREVSSFLNIKKYTTAAEAPWQNGLCERVHAVTDQILSKLNAEYPNVRLQTLLRWANMAKNSLQMNNGFSPHQLVFGINPNLPNIMNARIPALQENTTSEIFAKHLNLMQLARQAYLEAENSERIKRALRHNIRTNQEMFESGENVYYKREDSEKWLGPGKVMFQDGKVVFVRHGSVYVKVSTNRLVKANEENNQELQSQKRDNIENDGEAPSQKGDLGLKNIQIHNDEDNRPRKSHRLRDKERIDYNILHGGGEEEQINAVEVYVTTIPKEEQNTPECIKAKMAELEKLKEFDVYQEIEDEGYNTLSTRWVMTIKGEPRARLVVRGFEEEEMVQKDSPTVSKSAMRLLFTVAPNKAWKIKTTDIKSAFLQGKELDRIIYVKPPKEARKKEKKVVWRLKKCLYGLNDASRQFYMSVKDVLIQCGCRQSSVEPSLFYLLDHMSNIRGMLVSHIDDFLHGGDSLFEDKVITPLINRFTAGKLRIGNFTYVGFQITQSKNGIEIDQEQYVRNLSEDEWITPKRSKISTLTDEEQTQYRGIIGSINWCVRNSRPDLAFELTELSMKMKTATIGDWKRAIKSIKKLKLGSSTVYYPKIENLSDIKLEVFTDASFANLDDRVSSAMGYIVFATSGNKACSLGWRSGKIKRVVKSTLAAEALALSEGVGEAMYLQKMISEVLGFKPCIIAHVDSKGLVDQLHSTKLVYERMLRIDIGIIKEMLDRKELEEVRWCSTDKQLADVLTKRGADGAKLMNSLSTGSISQ